MYALWTCPFHRVSCNASRGSQFIGWHWSQAVTDLESRCCRLRLGALGQVDLEVTRALPAWLGAEVPGPGRRAAALRAAESASGALVQATPGTRAWQAQSGAAHGG